MTLTDLAARADAVLDAIAEIIVGKEDVLRLLLAALLANGHVLIEDVPGVAKTTIANALASALGLSFRRVQFTPDLLPADLTGSFIFDQRRNEFAFRRGPIFTHLLLADEINRAAPKTQSALLEAMQECQVTVEGESFALEPPFLVIATQNPIELEGTYPLPEAELDRFLIRIAVGYPSAEEEVRFLRLRREGRSDRSGSSPCSRATCSSRCRRPRGCLRRSFDRGLHRRSGPRDARGCAARARRVAAGEPRADEDGARGFRPRGARLRDSRRREAGGRPGAGAPAHAPAGELGRADRDGAGGRRPPEPDHGAGG